MEINGVWRHNKTQARITNTRVNTRKCPSYFPRTSEIPSTEDNLPKQIILTSLTFKETI